MERQKQFIIDIAINLFFRYGFKTITMDFIAKKGHVSQETIYPYFQNKEQLIDAVLIEIELRIKNQVTTISAETVNAIESLYRIYYYSFDTIFFNNLFVYNTLKIDYPIKSGLFCAILWNNFYENTKSQIEKGIANGIIYPQIESQEYCYTLISSLLNIHYKLLANFQNNLNLGALIENAIFYSLRLIVTSKGLIILDKERMNVKLPLFPSIFEVLEYRKLPNNL